MKEDKKTGFLSPTKHYSISGFDADAKQRFLEAYAMTFNIAQACAAVKVKRDTFYRAAKTDKAFRRAIDEVEWMKVDKIESTLYQRALEPNGFNYMITFLKTHPKTKEKYNPKTIVEHRSKESVNELFSRLESDGAVLDAELLPENESANNKDLDKNNADNSSDVSSL